MLEIILLWVLGRKVAGMCQARNRRAWPWVVLLVLSWYCGAGIGGIICSVAYLVGNPGAQEPPMLVLLGGVVGGAALGVTFITLTVSFLPVVWDEDQEDDDEYEDERPVRRADPYQEHDRRYRDEDDDRRPLR